MFEEDTSDERRKVVFFRVSKDEDAAIRKAAAARGIRVTTWMREAVRDHLLKRKP